MITAELHKSDHIRVHSKAIGGNVVIADSAVLLYTLFDIRMSNFAVESETKKDALFFCLEPETFLTLFRPGGGGGF